MNALCQQKTLRVYFIRKSKKLEKSCLPHDRRKQNRTVIAQHITHTHNTHATITPPPSPHTQTHAMISAIQNQP